MFVHSEFISAYKLRISTMIMMNDHGDAGNDEDLTVLDDRLLAGLLLKVHVCIHRLPASAENPETKTIG